MKPKLLRKKFRIFYLIVGVVFFSINIFCADTTAETHQYGGILKIINAPGLINIGLPGEPASFHDIVFARPAVESLVASDPDGTGKPVPLLATGWEISPDYTSITFTLRKGVKFHDGTDFNAEAAKYNLDKARTGVGIASMNLVTVKSVDIIDEYKIRVNLHNYDPLILDNMVGEASSMLSPTAIEKMGKECMTHPVGTGPYKFVEYKRDISLKFERFDDYWKGKPYLDGLEFMLISDPVTALVSFTTGEAHVLRDVSAKDAADLQSKGFVISHVFAGDEGLMGDNANPDSPFHDIRVRRAIQYAINSNEIAEALGYGFFSGTNQAAMPGGYAYNDDLVGYPYNPDKARALLTEAGYPNGFETSIIFSSSDRNLAVFTAVQGYLQEVGIKAKLDVADIGRFVLARDKGWKNQLIHSMFGLHKGPKLSMGYTMNLSKDRMFYKSISVPKELSDLIDKATIEKNLEEREKMFREIVKMEADNCIIDHVFISSFILAKSKKVQDLDLYEIDGLFFTPEKPWLSK